MSRIAVSIINYRTGDMTIAAAQSVIDVLGPREADVIIVDNASGDGSDDQIAAWIEKTGDARVKLIRSKTNSGFSGGHNQGMAAAPEADFYLILNSDALLRPGFFEPLLAAADADPKLGLIAPQLEFEDGTPQESCFRFQGIVCEVIRGAQSGPVSKLLGPFMVPLGLDPDPKEIRWASFACILLRAEMVREIGPMDEGYFLYFEDSEYSLRAYRAGWGVAYVTDAHAVHFRGGSGPLKDMVRDKKRLPPYFWRSRTRFLRQACGIWGPLLANIAWIIGRGIAQTRRLFGQPVPPAAENEWRDIWTNFFTPLAPAPETRR